MLGKTKISWRKKYFWILYKSNDIYSTVEDVYSKVLC